MRNYAAEEWLAALARAGFAASEAGRFRIRLEFAPWVERMRTPAVLVAAIRELQRAIAAETSGYFGTEPDGSFCLDVALFRATTV